MYNTRVKRKGRYLSKVKGRNVKMTEGNVIHAGLQKIKKFHWTLIGPQSLMITLSFSILLCHLHYLEHRASQRNLMTTS